jgi:integrase
MLGKAKEDGLLTALPFDRERPVPFRKLQGAKRFRYLGQLDHREPERFEAALAKEDSGVRTALMLLALTGMRRGELLGLKKSEIRPRECIAVIPPERSKSGRERLVRLNPAARKLLDRIKVTGLDGSYFPGPRATWMTRLKRAIARIRDAGVEDFHLHDLRHHFATKARMAGAPVELVMELLGHADLRSTQIYAHVGETELRAAVARVKL